MNNLLQSEAALAFLGRFLVASTVLSLIWEPFAGFYLATLLPAVNALFDTGALAIHLEREVQWINLVVRSPNGSVQNLRFSGYELLHLQAVAGVALFAATARLLWRSKVRWIAALLALFWLSQVWTLYEGTLISLAEYWAQLSASRREVLRQSGWSAELGDGASGVLYAWWNMWGGPALVLVLWIIAVQRDLLLEED